MVLNKEEFVEQCRRIKIMKKHRPLITNRVKTEEERLGPMLHGNRKITLEFKKLLDELTSIIGKGNTLSKEAVKGIFCLDNHQAKKYIVEKLIKEYPEKEVKIVSIINQLEPFITAEYPLIKEIIDKQVKDKWPYLDKNVVERLIFNELIQVSIENKYTDNFRFDGNGTIVDLDVAGNIINMDDN
jgi:hypothetical protein